MHTHARAHKRLKSFSFIQFAMYAKIYDTPRLLHYKYTYSNYT